MVWALRWIQRFFAWVTFFVGISVIGATEVNAQSGPGNGARWIAFYVPGSTESQSPAEVCMSFNAGGTYRGVDHFSSSIRTTSNPNAGKCTSDDPVLGYGFYGIGYYCHLPDGTERQGPCPEVPTGCIPTV